MNLKKKYMNEDGRSVLQPGDVIGLCGMTETPIDDWGVDMTTRSEISAIVGVSDNEPAMVEYFSLAQNYPNPFNPSTTIKYSIPSSVISNPNEVSGEKSSEFSKISPFGRNDNVHVTLKIYNILEREVTNLVNKE